MTTQPYYLTTTFTAPAGATLVGHIRVKRDSSLNIVAAGLTDFADGFLTERGATNGEYCTVISPVVPEVIGISAGAITAGAILYSAANGKVDDVDGGSAKVVGRALTAATGADQKVRIAAIG